MFEVGDIVNIKENKKTTVHRLFDNGLEGVAKFKIVEKHYNSRYSILLGKTVYSYDEDFLQYDKEYLREKKLKQILD